VHIPEQFDLGDLRLRRPRHGDAEAIFEYGSDPEVARYADWPVQTSIESIVALLEERAVRWQSGTEYSWVITESADNRAIGGITCRVDGVEAEIGYLLNRKFWGRGYATRVCKALVLWLESDSAIKKLWATCDTENIASIRVLEKSRFSREKLLEKHVARPNIGGGPRDAYLYSKVIRP